jgi:hypothetical protein
VQNLGAGARSIFIREAGEVVYEFLLIHRGCFVIIADGNFNLRSFRVGFSPTLGRY